MTKKSKHVLLDTVVVIDAHENGYWESLCNTYQIALPATVIEDELFYFASNKRKHGFKPSEWVEQGKVTRIDADMKDFIVLSARLKSDFMDSIDPGEREALAILLSKHHQQLFFATADRAAVRALGILGLGLRGISIEELLEGLSSKRSSKTTLPNHHTKKWFQQRISEGFSEQNLWLKPS